LEAGVPKAATPAEQVCYANRAAGPGGCINPEPTVHYRMLGLWRVFGIAQQSYTADGMSGQWSKPTWSELESIAIGCGEPWDATTLERVGDWLSGFSDCLPKPKKK
jgi:hypothetical protein